MRMSWCWKQAGIGLPLIRIELCNRLRQWLGCGPFPQRLLGQKGPQRYVSMWRFFTCQPCIFYFGKR